MKHPVLYLYLLVGLGYCALFSACGKQKPESVKKNIQAQLGQAQHFDVPIPLAFKLADTSTRKLPTTLHDFMRYTGALSVDQTVAFYKREMEQSGWDIADLSAQSEGFLYCTKPTKQCGIEVRSSGKPQKELATIISLFITQKA